MEIKELIGKTFKKVYTDNYEERLVFEGIRSFQFYHSQSCCERVSIVDICGDLSDLKNSPILQAEESSSSDIDTNTEDLISEDLEFCRGYEKNYTPDSRTWTFYRFGTIKGSVVIRWYGSSNGYYSERVEFGEF